MVWGVFIITIFLLSIIPLIYLSAIYSWNVAWYGIQALVSAIATLQGVLIYGKIKTDSVLYEHFQPNVSEEKQDPDPTQL